MGKNLKKLEKLAAPAGIDMQGLVTELAGEVAKLLPPTVDPDTIVEQTVEKVSALVAHKLSEVTESIKASLQSGQTDPKALIQGVADLLQPQMKVAADRMTAEAVAAARQAAEQVRADIEARLPKAPEDGAGGGNGANAFAPANLLSWASANMEGITKLVQTFRPQQSTDERIVQEALRAFRLTDTISRMRDGERDAGKLLQALKPTTPPAGT